MASYCRPIPWAHGGARASRPARNRRRRVCPGRAPRPRNPGHRLVGHVLNEMIALFGCFLGLDRIGALVERRIPLVRLAADETVEIFETAAARRPGVERSHRVVFHTGTSRDLPNCAVE